MKQLIFIFVWVLMLQVVGRHGVYAVAGKKNESSKTVNPRINENLIEESLESLPLEPQKKIDNSIMRNSFSEDNAVLLDDEEDDNKAPPLKLNLVFAGRHEIANPQVSPNGLYIAYTKPNYVGIIVYDVKRKSSTVVTKASGAGYYFNWAADSFRLVYRTVTLTTSSEVIGQKTKSVKAFRGSRKKHAIEVFDMKSKFKTKVFESMDYVGVPVWSQDGQHLFFATSDGGTNQFKAYRFAYDNVSKNAEIMDSEANFFYPTSKGIYRVRKGGKEVKKINPLRRKLTSVSLSPNQQRILYETDSHELYISNNDGKHLKQIDTGTQAVWSFDSRKIAYTNTNNPTNSAYADIYVYEVSSEKKVPITQTSHSLEAFPRFSRDNKRLFYTMRSDNGFYEANMAVNEDD